MSVQISREQSELQLDAFKMQLSPHFLFNNLNTLSHLIYQSPSTTEKYIRNLAKTYDYILKNSHLDLVPLQEEITFIKAYSYLLNIRFQDSLDISIEAGETETNYLLPPLSLQLLVENAVKHNAASPNEKLNVVLKLDKNYIEVKNNMLKPPKNLISSKVGLKNLKKRYSFFTEKLVEILINEYFIVRVPLIRKHG
ncbi:MAG: histidine kinase [Chloroflexia bacterium]|nr:histidine kinase [Chloroflexia bacterium]